MDWLLLLLLGSALFFVRDALLLGALRAGSVLKPAVAYTLAYSAIFFSLGTAADFISRQQALGLLRDARFWIPAILVHAALSVVFLRARGTQEGKNGTLWLILVPPPVLLYCAGGLCWLMVTSTRSLSAAMTGALLGCLWVVLLIAGSAWARRLGATRSRAAVLDFAAATNLSAILLLPLQQYSEQSVLAENTASWQTSAMALAATAGLIGASFLYHRLRRAP